MTDKNDDTVAITRRLRITGHVQGVGYRWHTVQEARRLGLITFCLTIDREGGGYLPHLFGPTGYAIVRSPEELPQRLPMFYAQLTH